MVMFCGKKFKLFIYVINALSYVYMITLFGRVISRSDRRVSSLEGAITALVFIVPDCVDVVSLPVCMKGPW